jgi:hypothetical protein
LEVCKRRHVLTFAKLQEELVLKWFGGALEKHYSKAVRALEKNGVLGLAPTSRLDSRTRLEYLGD